METEPTKDKKLKLAVKGLKPEQRRVYDGVLMRRRKELQQDSGSRNITVGERWEILEGVRSGAIKPARKGTPPVSGVDMRKVSRDFDERPASFIESSLPSGDRD